MYTHSRDVYVRSADDSTYCLSRILEVASIEWRFRCVLVFLVPSSPVVYVAGSWVRNTSNVLGTHENQKQEFITWVTGLRGSCRRGSVKVIATEPKKELQWKLQEDAQNFSLPPEFLKTFVCFRAFANDTNKISV